jgi:2,3-bisphosphoglycerate-independent phosphoglycerate mutase
MDLTPLLRDNHARIVLVVADGLGGYRDADHDTELAEASTPHLDALAAAGSTGLVDPVSPGITVGSGPGHLALFGYDPQEHDLGRGVLAALGVGFDLQAGDVAARGNLATVDPDGIVTDRRAGRIADEDARKLVDRLNDHVSVDGVQVFFRHIAEHRVLVVLRGEGLDPRLADTDPQETGVPARQPHARHPEAEHTARVVGELDEAMRGALQGERANALLLRGFDTVHELPSMGDRYGVRPATVAIYPMYRGVAQLVGMNVLPKPSDLRGQLAAMRSDWPTYDYWFLHHKKPDTAGHDGDRPAKVAGIEALDEVIPELMDLNPDVLVVTGDHSSPTQLSAHSWHPVPVVMWGPRVGRDDTTSFNEHAALRGALGRRPTMALMPEMLAAAGRLEKYGA